MDLLAVEARAPMIWLSRRMPNHVSERALREIYGALPVAVKTWISMV